MRSPNKNIQFILIVHLVYCESQTGMELLAEFVLNLMSFQHICTYVCHVVSKEQLQ